MIKKLRMQVLSLHRGPVQSAPQGTGADSAAAKISSVLSFLFWATPWKQNLPISHCPAQTPDPYSSLHAFCGHQYTNSSG